VSEENEGNLEILVELDHKDQKDHPDHEDQEVTEALLGLLEKLVHLEMQDLPVQQDH